MSCGNPSQRRAAAPGGPGYGALIRSYLWPQRLDVTLMGVLLIMSVGAEIAEPLVISYSIEIAQFGGDLSTAYRLIRLFFGITACRHMLRLPTTALSERVAWAPANALRGDRHLRSRAPVHSRAQGWGGLVWVIMTLILTATTAVAFGQQADPTRNKLPPMSGSSGCHLFAAAIVLTSAPC